MATVLPGSPPTFDKGNETGTVRAICNYLRSLHDNVDFQLGQIRKTQETQQNTIASLTEKNAGLKTELSTLRQDIETLQGDYEALAARVSALEGKN